MYFHYWIFFLLWSSPESYILRTIAYKNLMGKYFISSINVLGRMIKTQRRQFTEACLYFYFYVLIVKIIFLNQTYTVLCQLCNLKDGNECRFHQYNINRVVKVCIFYSLMLNLKNKLFYNKRFLVMYLYNCLFSSYFRNCLKLCTHFIEARWAKLFLIKKEPCWFFQ